MAKITLNLTEEHILLIKNLNFKKLTDSIYGIDCFDLYGGTWKWEQMALILGYSDKVIPETLESIFGPKYEKEIQDYMEELDVFISDNILNIEEILHQFSSEGIKPGKYTCMDNIHIWNKIN